MRAATLLAALALAALVSQAALAQEAKPSAPGLRLGPGATQKLLQQQKDGQPFAKYRQNEIRDLGHGTGAGVSYHENDVFVGSFKRSVSPYNGRVRPWVLDRGIYAKRSGERYVGRFHFFHNDWGEYNSSSMEISDSPLDGVYFLVGSLIPTDGPPRPGIYRTDVQVGGVYYFVPADQGYLAQFEQRYRGQVKAFKQAEEDSGGLSFGQLLALGLGVAAVSVADIPAADAVEIGGAFAADVLTKGETNALGGVVEIKRNQAAVSGGNAAAAPAGSGGGYQNETVTLSCPSGVSSSVPLQYKTQACRNAMIAFWKAYGCNRVGDIASATQQCKSACGNAQCRE